MQLLYFLCLSYIHFSLIDEADRTAVDYVCIWEYTSSESKSLHLFNSCYQMVDRSSGVSLSRFNDIKVEFVKDNSGCYNVAIHGIGRAKTSTYQGLCIYTEIEFILYNWYWSMAYICSIDPYEYKFIFPEFYKTVFKSGESQIDSNISHMFRKLYEHFYGIVQEYRKSG